MELLKIFKLFENSADLVGLASKKKPTLTCPHCGYVFKGSAILVCQKHTHKLAEIFVRKGQKRMDRLMRKAGKGNCPICGENRVSKAFSGKSIKICPKCKELVE